jgi:hypothetical protein
MGGGEAAGREARLVTHYIDRDVKQGFKEVIYFFTKGNRHDRFYSALSSTKFSLSKRDLDGIERIVQVELILPIHPGELVFKHRDGSVWITKGYEPQTDDDRRCINKALKGYAMPDIRPTQRTTEQQ